MNLLRISELRLYNRVPRLSNENSLLAARLPEVHPVRNAFFEGEPMEKTVLPIGKSKRIALVAHDNTKKDHLEWAEFNKGALSGHTLYATGTTGILLEKELGLEVHRLQSGPLGGDQQIGARIADGEIDFLMEHPCGLRPGHSGFHHLLAADVRRVPSHPSGLRGIQATARGERRHGPERLRTEDFF
jgi:methylglyoxal synthase